MRSLAHLACDLRQPALQYGYCALTCLIRLNKRVGSAHHRLRFLDCLRTLGPSCFPVATWAQHHFGGPQYYLLHACTYSYYYNYNAQTD